MKNFEFSRRALSAAVAAALLTACALRQGQELPSNVAAPGGSAQADAGNANKFLLYVSNGDGIVNVYRYWQHVLVAELINFTQPEGECADANGNVYIADYGAGAIDEYAHGGKAPLRVIDTSPYKPYGCAVNLKNGNLAVANYSQSSYYSQGNVAVYARAKGKPTYYSNKDLYHVNAVAYDKYGDLLATGFYLYSSYYLYTNFAYLPAKSKNYQEIQLPSPNGSGWYQWSVQGLGWDGEYWVVESYDNIYQYSINIKPELVGTVPLDGDAGPVTFYFADPKNEATNAAGGGSGSDGVLYFWKYPAGGEPYAKVTHGLDRPFGVALSVGK
ncbi:MAG: hypothetical protein WB609_01230 [Candidatus Cybelea sp.]